MPSIINKNLPQQLNNDAYNVHSHHYLREINTDSPEDSTEILNELGTTDDTIGEPTAEDMITTIGTTSNIVHEIEDTPTYQSETDIPNSASLSSDTGQTILIVLGLLLATLIFVCCVLACMFAKMRRRGFCTVKGKNQESCDDDCPGGTMSLQPSPKDSLTSARSENSRSSDRKSLLGK